jgi:hypothetical protein
MFPSKLKYWNICFCTFSQVLIFVTMNLSPFKLESVDIVCFYPETLDPFIVGCTIGVMKDD